jgi:hypothetical protein
MTDCTKTSDAQMPPISVVEEIEIVEEDRYVLVQFPSLKNFGDVRLVPRQPDHNIPVVFTDRSSNSTNEPQSHNVSQLTVETGTLETGSPVMNFGSCVFRGTWRSQVTSKNRTNLVVVELKDESSTRESKRQRSSTVDVEAQQVPSLLAHLPHGTDTDTAAKRRRTEESEKESQWKIGSIIAPSAVLVMERIA